MSESAIILDRLKKKETEIQGLEERLRAAKIYVQALHDVLAAIGHGAAEQPQEGALRPGGTMTLVRDAILREKKPLHISNLLGALGKDVTKEARASLASSLASYVRRGEMFTRPAPNTFGLIELGKAVPLPAPPPEPPTDFGRPKPATFADEGEEIPF